MTNSIQVTNPYKLHGQWVFDDPEVGLAREPFVAGADAMIDLATAYIVGAGDGFTMLSSGISSPGHPVELNWIRDEAGGNVYAWEGKGMLGWLYPALLKYFDSPPGNIYVQVKASELEKDGSQGGKIYRLLAGTGEPSLAASNTLAES